MKKIAETPKSTTKTDLIASIAELSGLSKTDSSRALGAFMLSIQQALKDGKTVRLTGFGSFGVAHLPAREGRNPRTGETIKLKVSKSPRFRAGKVFRDAIA